MASETNSPWDGTEWNVAGPDIDQPAGNAYKEIYDLRKGVAVRMNKEHETLATTSGGGVHKQGSARAFFQDAAPATQVDGSAFDSGDLGSLWFDSNSTPDNMLSVLTATTPTWTPVSTEIIAVAVAAAHQWAAIQTFDLEAVFTLGLQSSGPVTLNANADLIGSATSDITINETKFTVAGATGNTVVAGTLGVTGVATLGTIADGAVATTQSAGDDSTKLATTAYVDTAKVSFGWTVDSTEIYAAATKNASWEDLDIGTQVAGIGSNAALVLLKVHTTLQSDIAFRVNGETGSVAGTGVATEFGLGASAGTPAADKIFYAMIQTDSGGIVEWVSEGNTGNQTVTMVGYMVAAS